MALVIHAKEFVAWTDQKIDVYLTAMGSELHSLSRQAASRTNTGVTIRFSAATRKRRKNSKFLNKTQRTIYPDPSKPDESPKRRTGFGQKNIVWGYSRTLQVARVGYTRAARYMTFHELGIRYSRVGLQQRPTIIPSLKDNRQRILAVGKRASGMALRLGRF